MGVSKQEFSAGSADGWIGETGDEFGDGIGFHNLT